MKVLVINAGSSSLKYQFFESETGAVLAKGGAERIGLDDSIITHTRNGDDKVVIETDLPDHKDAMEQVLSLLTSPNYGVIQSMMEIDAVGHRVVHGGEKFSASALITPSVKAAIRVCYDLAPLHNPPNMTGVEACEAAMPGVPQVAVFDTAFHQTMPAPAYMYALPYEMYEEYRVRRYGFHGTSHRFVSQRCSEIMGKPLEELKIITCHLGNGSSIAAVDHGECVDTSMGLTPLAGVCMGTRCGDIDPAIVTFLMQREGLDNKGIDSLMNKKSGVLGVSGVSSDFRDLEEAAGNGNKRARLALDMFVYHCKKYVGAYAAAMGGVDALVFTAGIGENNYIVREGIASGLGYMGIQLDEQKNHGVRGVEKDLSVDGSTAKVFVIPTNEELAIARETEIVVRAASAR
ncbi:MAG TPA: acetate kinase [Clostridiaceae bacterium]|nr:acetate kinase [Clostridiaceae bacterium]